VFATSWVFAGGRAAIRDATVAQAIIEASAALGVD